MHLLLVGPDLEANLSLGYLAASLQAAGHRATIAPFNAPADAAAVLARAAGVDAVGLSLSFQVRAPQFLELAARLKAQRPAQPLIAGGHFASCAAERLLRDHPALDLVVIHEAERSLVELAALGPALLARAAEVPGVVRRDGEGTARSAPRAVCADLDALPWPDRSGPARLVAGVPTAYMMGSRGCVRSCDYCCIATLHRAVEGPRFRRRSPTSIADEMAQLYHQRGVRQFVFHDDNFLLPDPRNNAARLGALSAALEARGLRDLGLVMKSGPRDCDRAALEQLLRLGLLRIFLGIESSTQAGMDSIGRRQTPAEAEAAVALCEALDLSSQYTMIIFHPEATAETMLGDLDFVTRHPAHPLNYCRAEIYAGTPLEQRVLAQGRARGGYMARTYSYADPRVARVWDQGKDLFAGRCWGAGELLGQVIRLDHQFAVLRHFYPGARVAQACADFAAFEVELNLETAALFRQLVEACAEATGDGDRALRARLDELARREQRSRPLHLARLCALRQELERLTAPVFHLVERGPGPAPRWAQLPRHAAAVLVAAGLMSAGCKDLASGDKGSADAASRPPIEDPRGAGQAPLDASPAAPRGEDAARGEEAGSPEDAAQALALNAARAPEHTKATGKKKRKRVLKAKLPGTIGVRKDKGVAEAAPPPYDEELLYRRDDGVAEAAPPPYDDKKIIAPDLAVPEGTLTLITTPRCTAFVDGKRIGTTPLRGIRLPVGEHQLKLVNEQLGISRSQKLRINRNKLTTLKLDLGEGKKK